jgi:hypothetical protein
MVIIFLITFLSLTNHHSLQEATASGHRLAESLADKFDQRLSQVIATNAANTNNYAENMRGMTHIFGSSVLDYRRSHEGMNSHYNFIRGATLSLLTTSNERLRHQCRSSRRVTWAKSCCLTQYLQLPAEAKRQVEVYFLLLHLHSSSRCWTLPLRAT